MMMRRALWSGLLLMALATAALCAQTNIIDPESKPIPLLQDTLYVLDSLYLEIDLDQQEIYRHYSDGRIDSFLCSTGNSRLPQGIATRPGIFTIKWKAERHVSGRFKVPMLYWMPFDGGIGFHALEGNDYYIHLGYSPSSHGCVRVSNETGDELFQTTPAGTIVYVHEGTPARILRFAGETTRDLRVLKSSDRTLLRRRLAAVVEGRPEDPALRAKLAIPRKFASKIDVGRLATETASEPQETPYGNGPAR